MRDLGHRCPLGHAFAPSQIGGLDGALGEELCEFIVAYGSALLAVVGVKPLVWHGVFPVNLFSIFATRLKSDTWVVNLNCRRLEDGADKLKTSRAHYCWPPLRISCAGNPWSAPLMIASGKPRCLRTLIAFP